MNLRLASIVGVAAVAAGSLLFACSSSSPAGSSWTPAPYPTGYGYDASPPPTCDATSCAGCTCPTATWCATGRGCVPLSTVGQPCEDDRSCASGNCGKYTKTCRVALGTACTPDVCDICLQGSGGSSFSYCSRDCGDLTDCGQGLCVGRFDGDDVFGVAHYICKPRCNGFIDSSCPGTRACSQVSGSSDIVCACDVTGDCSANVANPLGAPCGYGSSCKSGYCAYAGSEWAPRAQSECSAPCAKDADCGDASLACVAVDLSGPSGEVDGGVAGTFGCLPRCTDSSTCTRGTCLQRPGASGAPVGVCDPHQPDGSACNADGECVSGRCSSAQTCISSQGAANGSTCATSADCASKVCLNNVCKGASQIGGPCSSNNDCSVGTCCASGTCC